MRRIVWALPVLLLAARAGADEATERRLRELEDRVARLERKLAERHEGMLPLGELLTRARGGDPEARERLKRVAAEIHEALRAHAKKHEKTTSPEALREEIGARLKRFEREMKDPGAKREAIEERIFRHQMALRLLEEVENMRAELKAAIGAGRHDRADGIERSIHDRLRSVHELVDLPGAGAERDEPRARKEKLERSIAETEDRLEAAKRDGKEREAEELRGLLAPRYEALQLLEKALAVAEELRRADAGADRGREEELRAKLADLDARIDALLQKKP